MKTVYLNLGSNVGNREKYIRYALDFIKAEKEILLEKVSSIYVSKPFGVTNQPEFYNLAAIIKTSLLPSELLAILKNIEFFTGRKERPKWEKREIDIDIMLFENLFVECEDLIIPHKDFEKRDFFVIPILELDRNILNPYSGKPLSELIFEGDNSYITNQLKFEYKVD